MNTPSTYLKKVVVSLVFVALIVFVQSTSIVVSAATNSASSSSAIGGKESGWGTRPPQECTADMKNRDTLKGQVQNLQFQIDANVKAADMADAETKRLKKLMGTSTSATATSTSATATSTATTTQSTFAPYSFSLSPNTIRPGESFDVNVNINSASIQKYSINVYQNGTLIASLISGATVTGTSRPAYVQKTFQTSASMPTGSYIIKIVDDNNASVSQTATLNLIQTQSSGTDITTTGFSNTSSNTTTVVGLSSISFANPFPYGILPRDKNTQIVWSASGNTNASVSLYLQTSCVKTVPICTQYNPNNPTSSCITIKSSCKAGSGVVVPISTVPASSSVFNWVVPRNLVDTVGVIYAEQNGQRVGSTGQFYISY